MNVDRFAPQAGNFVEGHSHQCAIGTLPPEWLERPLWTLAVVRNERNPGELPLLSVFLNRGVVFHQSGAGQTHAPSLDLSAYQVVHPGDFVLNNQQAWRGSVGVSPHHGIVSPAYIVLSLSPRLKPRYADYLLASPAMVGQYVSASKGVGDIQRQIYWPYLRNVKVPLPPGEAQEAIVRFLDHVNARIRRYIAAKRKLIALLNEQKQAIIHRAVTRGLDANVRLKPSGVEWLGDVPERWNVRSIGSAAVSVQTGPFGSQLHSSDYRVGGIPVVNPSHLTDSMILPDERVTVSDTKARELSVHRLCTGDIVTARRGELGRSAVVASSQEGWLCGTGSIRIRLNPVVLLPEYLVYVLQSSGAAEALISSSVGATMNNLSAALVSRFRVPVPPLFEQAAIAAHVVRHRAQADATLQAVQRQIEHVREFRTRLVADVVIGRLDVREAAARLSVADTEFPPEPSYDLDESGIDEKDALAATEVDA